MINRGLLDWRGGLIYKFAATALNAAGESLQPWPHNPCREVFGPHGEVLCSPADQIDQLKVIQQTSWSGRWSKFKLLFLYKQLVECSMDSMSDSVSTKFPWFLQMPRSSETLVPGGTVPTQRTWPGVAAPHRWWSCEEITARAQWIILWYTGYPWYTGWWLYSGW